MSQSPVNKPYLALKKRMMERKKRGMKGASLARPASVSSSSSSSSSSSKTPLDEFDILFQPKITNSSSSVPFETTRREEDSWICIHCTYSNKVDHVICEMCFEECEYDGSESSEEEEEEEEDITFMRATELAHLRQEMEAKVRAEMEMKIRQEMDEKMEYELVRMEEKRKAQEERHAVDAMKEERREKVLAKLQSEHNRPGDHNHVSKFRAMIEFVKREKVLMYQHTYWSNYSCALYLSETHVGLHIIVSDQTVNIQEIRPFYWFDYELTRRDLTIWDNLEMPENSLWKKHNVVGRIHSDIALRNWNIRYVLEFQAYKYSTIQPTNHSTIYYNNIVQYDEQKSYTPSFQTIVRLIPGGYRNGPWRPLDGFFGPYMNEETLEIISLIPEYKL